MIALGAVRGRRSATSSSVLPWHNVPPGLEEQTAAPITDIRDPRLRNPGQQTSEDPIRRLLRELAEAEAEAEGSAPRNIWPWVAGVGGALAAFFVLRRVL